MCKKITILFLFVCSFCALNAQVVDDFNDGDFTTSPTWTPSAGTDFKDTLGMLRSNNTTASSTYFISTPSTLANNCQWEFFVNLKFSTSGANYVDCYLTADNANLASGTLNGYFVRIGNTTDEISLYRNVAGTVTEILDGIDAIVSSSTNNLIKIKVVRDASNQFTLSRDMTGTGSTYVTEGSITDATFTTSAFFGFLVRQSTATFFKKHFFDDVYAGAIIVDAAPPTLVSATPLTSTTLDVLFSEPLETTSAQTLTNYTVNNSIGNPTVATQDGTDPALMHLTFSTPFVNLVNYEIVVDNVTDVALNPIDNDTLNFSYFIPDTAVSRDVVINEIMADESPQVALPAAEFIELYNNSSKNFDLSGWTFSDGSTTATFGTKLFTPGQYLIICAHADTASFSPFGNVLGVSSWPSLNNSGDALTLKNNFGTTIDFVNYDIAWYNDAVKDDGGWTLEQINPSTTCTNASNWSASTNVAGGTPGTVNSIYSAVPDVTAPTMGSASLTSATQLTVIFTEPLDTSAAASFVFTMSGGLTITGYTIVSPGLNQIDFTFSPSVTVGTSYDLIALNVADCEGNGAGMDDTISFMLYPQPNFRDVVINEILPIETPQVGLPAAEFIELHNTSANTYNTLGWTLSDVSATTTLSAKTIGPGQYLILCANADTSNYSVFGNVLGVSSFPSLNNTGDDLTLKDSAGNVIDMISYNSTWWNDETKDGGGWSIEQINPLASCVNAVNWHASNDVAGGTPGTVNSVYNTTPDTAPPGIISSTLNSATQLTITFSEALDTSASATYVFTVSGGITVSSFSVVAPALTSIIVNFTPAVDSGILYTLTATNITDCEGNGIGVTNSTNFILAFGGLAKEIIINEVLFNPTTGVSDFIEVYNNSTKVINLKNWMFANVDNDTIDNHKTISTVDLLLQPGEYYAFTPDKTALVNYYVNAAQNRIVEIPSLPTYDNDSSTVILISANNLVIDRFSYTEEMQFPLLNSVEGVSLERMDFNRATNDAGNWHSAAEQAGFATPGYVNSQFNPNTEGDDELSLNTDIFSPDNDGYQDVINFNYEFTETGYVGNATLYDAKGREIRKLLRNELLSAKGTFTWNGINDKNEKSQVGIYVIYFEYFNLSGTVKKIKKSFVLAAKF
ncbi:MAG TPA: lamin tail domain-containing protein [Flavobacteriales bacterium]|nr:lamin tail domain-containing protein [Flavobacteriales bacterium]